MAEESVKLPVRILVVDDHPVVRAGLTSMLGTRPELKIQGSVATGAEALEFIKREPIDVILLDLRMPGMSGIDVLAALRHERNAPRAIVLTTYELDEDVYQAVNAGAQGYLLKNISMQEMLGAIKEVHQGRRYLPKHIAAAFVERATRTSLTARELEILSVLSRGLTNKEIGVALSISENTVRNHINSITEKLEVSSRTEAATAAIRRGIIPED
jgi:two-component system NarL family response regulator